MEKTKKGKLGEIGRGENEEIRTGEQEQKERKRRI